METRQTALAASKVLTEKRPSLTGWSGWLTVVVINITLSPEAELTPIVVSQLQNTKKHKDELRKARRGSQPKTESPAAAGSHRLTQLISSEMSSNNDDNCQEV